MTPIEVQTRSETDGLRLFPSLKEAMDHAARDESVWKVSFSLPTDERVRLVRREDGWLYEPIDIDSLVKAFGNASR